MPSSQDIHQLLTMWYNVFLELSELEPQNKLLEVVHEFLGAEPKTSAKLEEAADVCIVMMTQLLREGWTPTDLAYSVIDKLQININREWVTNADGTISHRKGTR